MPLNSEVSTLIDNLYNQGFSSFEEIGVEATRETIEGFTQMQQPTEEVARLADAAYGTDPAHRLKIYTPAGEGPFGVVVNFYGGGFIAGSIEVADERCRALANQAGLIVVSAGYRPAPEHRFPSAHDDARAALRWVKDNIADHGGDPNRLAVMGDSAGGNLALSIAATAKEDGIELAAQVLVYPLVDPAADTESKREFAEGYVLHNAAMTWFGEQYVSSPDDLQDSRLTIPLSDSLGSLPPTLILTVEYDVLRDEGEEFGEQLSQAGVEATVRRFEGLVHGSYWLSGAVPDSVEMTRDAAAFLSQRLKVG